MGNKVTLKLDERTVHGKKVAKLRDQGLVPGVVYGASTDPINVQVAANVFDKVYRQAGTYTPVHLTIGTKKKIAMIKEIDFDTVKSKVRHISFHAVKASDPVVTTVPIQLVGEGESEAEKNGLIILQALNEVEVRALPMDLPESIEVSIVDLKEEGEKITLAAAILPEGVEYVQHTDGRAHDEGTEELHVTDQLVASVWEPAALEAANASAAGSAEDESEVESENGEADTVESNNTSSDESEKAE